MRNRVGWSLATAGTLTLKVGVPSQVAFVTVLIVVTVFSAMMMIIMVIVMMMWWWWWYYLWVYVPKSFVALLSIYQKASSRRCSWVYLSKSFVESLFCLAQCDRLLLVTVWSLNENSLQSSSPSSYWLLFSVLPRQSKLPRRTSIYIYMCTCVCDSISAIMILYIFKRLCICITTISLV